MYILLCVPSPVLLLDPLGLLDPGLHQRLRDVGDLLLVPSVDGGEIDLDVDAEDVVVQLGRELAHAALVGLDPLGEQHLALDLAGGAVAVVGVVGRACVTNRRFRPVRPPPR
ncbi:hypothetical protein BRD56_04825 [Thermoplasmatales archaeon SW_10_69_26]|nr:MAG: hypothetical protein BRD56_04825 [Thermoplasmatales archaeon SW_10_69_26]